MGKAKPKRGAKSPGCSAPFSAGKWKESQKMEEKQVNRRNSYRR